MDWFKINLAPFYYHKITHPAQGVIKNIEYKKSTINKESFFQAVATLQDSLRPKSKNKNVIYGNSDGTGTHKSLFMAQNIAITEALERWAFYHCAYNKELSKKYCFDIIPSTTGMAAFPGIFAQSARTNALCEAIERHSLLSFWEGQYPVKKN